MDPRRFDSLVQSLGTATSRRGALVTLLLGLVAPLLPGLAAARRKRKGKGKDRDTGKGRGSGKAKTRGGAHGGNNGPNRHKGKSKGKAKAKRLKKKKQQQAGATAEDACFPRTANCQIGMMKNGADCNWANPPGFTPSKNLFKFNGARANFRLANFTGANLSDANLSNACLVDADLTGANLTRVNMTGAILCRTKRPDGAYDHSGCGLGTACCPTCDSTRLCPISGQTCCDNRCVPGNCCTNAQCLDPARPICLNGTCTGCTSSAQCGTGKICCGGQCRVGNCCTENNGADCADLACKTAKTCVNNQCSYTNLGDGTACDDGNACTENDRCQGGTCVPGPLKSCPAADQCRDAGGCDPATGACSNSTKPNGTPCNADNNICTLGDTCQNGSCVAGPTLTCIASDECHVAGVCGSTTGFCSNPNAPDGKPCGINGSCHNGRCVETCLVLNAVCDPADDTCCSDEEAACAENAACSDGGEGRCCRPEGAFCDFNCDCCNGVCSGNVCCNSNNRQCSGPDECCEGYDCVNNECQAVCGTTHAICGAGQPDCCPGFRCVNGDQCFPETCKAPQEQCSTAADCCDSSITTCQGSDCCRPFNQVCQATNECCGVAVCGPEGRCCRSGFSDPESFQTRGCLDRQDQCCPGWRCSPTSAACCRNEGETVPPYQFGFLDCCHFAERDGLCVCHDEGQQCSAPGGNPFLSTCCDGLICVNNICNKPCSPWNGAGCLTDADCCRGTVCRNFACGTP